MNIFLDTLRGRGQGNRSLAGTVLAGSLALVLGAGGCASTSSSGKGTTSAGQGRGRSSGDDSSRKGDSAPVEQDVNVTLKHDSFPPVDAGAWVCEPKTWTDKVLLLHCTAPAGSTDLVGSLKQVPQVVTADLAK